MGKNFPKPKSGRLLPDPEPGIKYKKNVITNGHDISIFPKPILNI